MTPVFQTILNNKNGNCLAAVWASLLHLKIEEVPNFVEFDDDHAAVCNFLKPYRLEWDRYLINPNRELTEEAKSQYEGFYDLLPDYGDVGGFYEATVFSPGYKGSCHAVIVDRYFNIVHDPCPHYKNVKYPHADELGYNGIIGVSLWRWADKNN